MVKNKVAEAIYEEAATLVWWDIDNCPIPKGCRPERIVEKIRSALNKLNYRGNMSIFAFGMDHIPPSVKKALSSTGITLNDVNSSSERGEVSMHIFDDVLDRRYDDIDNPPPGNLMFICRGDGNDRYRFDQERQMGYNVLVAHPEHASDSLVASAKTTWLWKSILEEPDV